MDMFTDVDIFADILNAALRNVAVYVLLDELNAHHFVAMVNNFRVSLDEIKFMRVRTVSGSTYFCHTGKFFKGQMMNCFMLVDCRVVLSGNYSFMWSFEKIHRCIAHVFLGQLVTPFDKEFRILYAQSEPLVAEIPMAYVEDHGNFSERHYNIENKHMFKREYPPIKNIHAEWPRHLFEDHMNANAKILSFRRGDLIQSTTEENLPFKMHGMQQFRGEQSLDHRRHMKGLNTKEISDFQRFGYTGLPSYAYVSPQKNAMNSGKQQMEDTEIQSTHLPREQFCNQRTGPEPSYEKYSKSRDYSYHQFTAPDCPDEIDDPSGDYNHVHRYLQSYPDVEIETTGNLSVPVQSVSRRLSMGQSNACQNPPIQPNPPEQKCFLNVHHKQQEQKEGLRDWRVSSYLTTLQHGGQDNMTDLQRTDPFVSVPYVIQVKSCEPNISEIKQGKSETPKVSTSRLVVPVPPMNNVTLPENSVDLERFRPTTSESSRTTEGDKVEEIQNREPKETSLIREEFFRRKPNLPLQRSSRLRHSLIFNSNLEQDTSEEIRNSLSQKDAENPLKHSHFVSNILEKKIAVTREPFHWSNLAKSICEPSSGSTIYEDIPSKTEQTSVGDETTHVKDTHQKITLGPQSNQLQDNLAENSQISRLPFTALQRSVSFIDMDDHQRRSRYFKDLATKHKEHVLVELPKLTKEKDPKECDKKSLFCNLAEQIESDLNHPQTPQSLRETLITTPQTLLVDTLENSEDSIPKHPVLQTLPDKHLKHKLAPDHTSVPKCDNSSKVIPDTATDAEKIHHKKKLTGGCNLSSNGVQEKRAANLVVELGAKPKLTSLLISTSSPEFMYAQSKLPKMTESVASDLPSMTSLNNSNLNSTDSISSHVITGANIFPKRNIMQTNTSLSDYLDRLSPVKATATNTSLSIHPAAKETVCFIHSTATETGSSKNDILPRLGHSHFTPAESHSGHPIVTSANTETPHPSVTETGPFQHSTVVNNVSLIHSTVTETDSSKHPTQAEKGPCQASAAGPAEHSTTTESGPSQHSTPTFMGHCEHPADISSVHNTVIVTDQHPVSTSARKSIPKLSNIKEAVSSIQAIITGLDQHPPPINTETDSSLPPSAIEMVSSVPTTVAVTEQHSIHTSPEEDTPQNSTVSEMDISLKTAVTVADHNPTHTTAETDSPQYPTATELVSSLHTSGTVIEEHLTHLTITLPEADIPQPHTAPERVCSLNTEVTDQHCTPTPPEENIPQHLMTTDSSLYTTVKDQHYAHTSPESISPRTEMISSLHTSVGITEQHPTPAPTERDTPQHPTATAMVSSLCTTVPVTDQHLTLIPPEIIISQNASVTELVSSTNATILVTEQHPTPTPGETDTPQYPTATEPVSSLYTIVTVIDQHSTLIPTKADTPQPQTAPETVCSLNTAVIDEHPALASPETDTPQHPTAAAMASSLCNTVTVTDKCPISALVVIDTPQNVTATDTVSSSQVTVIPTDQHSTPTVTERHNTLTPPEIDTPQAHTATETVCSLHTEVTDQYLTPPPPQTDTSQHFTATESNSLLYNAITFTDQHPTLNPAESIMPGTETISSLHTSAAITEQHPTPDPSETDTPQHPTAAALVSCLCTTVTVKDQHLTLTPPEAIIPQHATVIERDSSAHTTITVTEKHATSAPGQKDTPQYLPATEMDSSLQTTVRVTDQHPTHTPPGTNTLLPPPVSAMISSEQTTLTGTDPHPTPNPTERDTQHLHTTEMDSSQKTTVTVTEQYSTFTPVQTDIPQYPKATEPVSSLYNTVTVTDHHPTLSIETNTVSSTHITLTDQHTTPTPPETNTPQPPQPTVIEQTSKHSTPAVTGLLTYFTSAQIDLAEYSAAGTSPCTTGTETVPSIHSTPAETVLSKHLTSTEMGHAEHPAAQETVSSIHITKTKTGHCQHPTSIEASHHHTPTETGPSQHHAPIETGPFQHPTPTETGHSQNPTPRETGHFQSSAPAETFHTGHPAVHVPITVTNQPPTSAVTDISQHSTAIDTVSSVYTALKVTEKPSTPTMPETAISQYSTATETSPSVHTIITVRDQHYTASPVETDTPQHHTATETAPSKHYSHVEIETAQHPTATAIQSFQHSFAADTGPTQNPTSTISITSTSEKVKSSFGVRSLSQVESESCLNMSETFSITNTTDKDISQNVSLLGPTSSTEPSQCNISSNCAPPECNSSPFSKQKEATSENIDAQTKQSPSLNASVMDGLSHNSSAVCKPASIVREIQRTHEITRSACHISSKPEKELCCSHYPKTEENKEENQRALTKKKRSVHSGRHGTPKFTIDVDNSKVYKAEEFPAQVANVGFSNAEQSQEPQICLTPCTDLVVQQQPSAGKKSILSSYQSSTANVLSCSNLRDDTKVLLEQISAKNHGRTSNLTHEANGNRDKQTSGHRTKTWSSKASPEEREKLLKRIDSMRKERKVYSRFEA
ncbi:mucin-3A isoform X2 [Electrophorus electricus]|nr:mucin-3A isoform X2 [Electrophorus electricus]